MVRFRNLRGGQQEEEAPPSGEAEASEEDGQEAQTQEDEPGMADDDDTVEVETGDEGDEALDLDEEPLEDLADEPEVAEKGQGDAALKELAARMAVLQSNLESVQGTRGEIEDKLSKMEERMMRLGSLAEAVSSKYNPFIAENSPEEPSWEGSEAEAVEAAPEQAPAAPSPPAQARPEPEPEPEPAPEPTPEPPKASTPEADAARAEELEELAGMLGEPSGQPAQAPDDPPDAIQAAEALSQDRPQLGDRLESKFMMLEWVDLMLRRVGRANLLDLLEYYEGLGWLDQGTKRHVIRVAVGMDAPDRPEEKQRGEWRGDLDLHERSLITIERLHGNDISAADVESLRMDMQRFFGE